MSSRCCGTPAGSPFAHSRISPCGENVCEPSMAKLLPADLLHAAPAFGTAMSACAIPADTITAITDPVKFIVATVTLRGIVADGRCIYGTPDVFCKPDMICINPGRILADHPFGKRTAQPTVW